MLRKLNLLFFSGSDLALSIRASSADKVELFGHWSDAMMAGSIVVLACNYTFWAQSGFDIVALPHARMAYNPPVQYLAINARMHDCAE